MKDRTIKALPEYLQPKILSAVAYIHEAYPNMRQSIDMAKKMGLTISETDILATTSKGIVVSNQDILNHLASLKNKTQTREQKIALREIYDQQQSK